MKIVVTGALGHIGSALIRYLPLEFPEAEIVMIDNLYTQRYCSLFNLKGNYKFIEADARACKIPDCNVVVHLAAYSEPHADLDWAHNYSATLNIVRQSQRIVFPSTMSVFPEPQTAYAETKFKEEILVSSLSHHTVFRLGNLFGPSPGMRFHTAVSKFCWQATMRQPLSIWKTAYQQRRPYLDLIDVCRAICAAIKYNHYGTYSLVTQNATVSDIVGYIEEYIQVKIDFVDSPNMNSVSQDYTSDLPNFKFIGDLHRGIAATLDLLGRP